MTDSEKNILDHLAVIVGWRRMIFFSFLTVSIATAGISLILPEAFRSSALIYPPQESQDMFGLSALLSNLPTGLLGIGEVSVAATDYEPVLKSERVRLRISERFKLADRYQTATRWELLEQIGNRLQVELSREQFLSVSYEDETPQLAADITNAFVEELEAALQERSREQASHYRAYLERRLEQARGDMDRSEIAFYEFQKEHHTYDLESQAKAQIEGAAQMFSSLAELRIEREVSGRMMTADHPRLKELDLKIEATEKALDEMLMGRPKAGSDDIGRNGALPEPFIPFASVPGLGLEVVRLMREVRIQNAIYQFIQQEYEKTRFEEERETSLVTVLDPAVPPDFRSRPRRTLMVLTAGGLSLVFSALLAFLFEALGNLSPANQAKVESIARALKRE